MPKRRIVSLLTSTVNNLLILISDGDECISLLVRVLYECLTVVTELGVMPFEGFAQKQLDVVNAERSGLYYNKYYKL